MAIPISVQLYSLRDQAKQDHVSVLKTLAKIGFVGVETAGLYNRSAREIRRVLDGEGLKASSAHVPITDPTKWNQIEDDAEELGYKYLISPYISPDVYNDKEKVIAAAAQVNAAIARFEPRGYSVGIHNHDWEFAAPDRADLLLSLAPRCCVEADIYWVKVGGVEPAELINRYARRTPLLHIKDGPLDKSKAMTAVGQGRVDVSSAIRAGEGADVKWLVVELDRCDTDMMEAVRQSYNHLVGHGLAKGNR